MPDVLSVHEPLLVNMLGHSAGALIFGIFVYLLVRDRVTSGLAGSRLTLIAAWLAFAWNLASLVVIAVDRPGSVLSQVLVAVSSSVISLLPAVLLHLCLGSRLRPVMLGGYLMSTAAITIHLSELVVDAPARHSAALLMTTIGFGVLTLVAVAGAIRSKGDERKLLTSRTLGTMSLFLFSMSFVHLGSSEAHASWPVELLAHHAGIPLALFVLLQDYRFLLLDAFIRFLANMLFAATFVFLVARGAEWLGWVSWSGGFREGLMLVGGCLVLVGFAVARSRLEQLLTHIVFRRPDLNQTLMELRTGPEKAPEFSELEYAEWVGTRMARFMSAPLVGVEPLEGVDLRVPVPVTSLEQRHVLESRGVAAVVPLRFGASEVRYALLGRRAGGRRYLSEDLEALNLLSGQSAETMEQFHASQMQRLVSQAELRALQSQIHPHFLFNALNTLYGVIPREAAGARRTVLNLADIFRYFLETGGSHVPLEEELRIIKAYLEIEALRLGPKLRTRIEVDEEALQVMIPLLSVEPLVENAVKHGVAAKTQGGEVHLEARCEEGGLRIRVHDTGSGFVESGKKGVGLDNVKQRLQLCYGPSAALAISSSPGGTTVEFVIPARRTLAEAVR